MNPTMEKLTDGVAMLAIISWVNDGFYHWLQGVSELAAIMTPILGLVWLIIQIYVRLFGQASKDEK